MFKFRFVKFKSTKCIIYCVKINIMISIFRFDFDTSESYKFNSAELFWTTNRQRFKSR